MLNYSQSHVRVVLYTIQSVDNVYDKLLRSTILIGNIEYFLMKITALYAISSLIDDFSKINLRFL